MIEVRFRFTTRYTVLRLATPSEGQSETMSGIHSNAQSNTRFVH